jgi:hypothetical protein
MTPSSSALATRSETAVGTFGISSEAMNDERVKSVGSAFGLWVASIAWNSRTRRSGEEPVMRLADLADLGPDIDPTDIDRLVLAGLWAGNESLGWTVVENGLWSLDPDSEPDVLGDGPDALLE